MPHATGTGGTTMWDRPDLLNGMARLLFGAAVLLALYGALMVIVRLPAFALEEVRLDTAPSHVTRDEVERVVRRELRGTFFTVDLEATGVAFEALPWVRRAEVRRRWPGGLVVELEEHVPLARWADVALVNTHGELFEAHYAGPLPLFVGPPDAAKEIAIQFEYFRRSLALIGHEPVAVRVSPRRAWRLTLKDGLTLELGREHIEARLARFVGAYGRTVAQLGRRVDHVDLRYANGFAVRIPELGDPGETGARTRGRKG
jgi:cell division protein FtsQ